MEENNQVELEKSLIDELVKKFFHLFTNRDGVIPQLDLIYEMCIPEAIIIKKEGLEEEIYDLKNFIRPRKVMLSDGTLTEFVEEEIYDETKVIKNIAHRFVNYKKSGIMNGIVFEQCGTKLFQFVKTNRGWRISSVVWEDE